MKKLFGIALALTALLLLPATKTAFADEEVKTLYAVEANSEGLDNATEQTDHALYEDAYGYIGLKSADNTGKIIFNADVATAGKYELRVIYAAKEGSSARKLNLTVNDGATSLVNLTCAADWDTFMEYKVYVQLNAGTNTIIVGTPSDYDNDAVKTPNVYAIQYVLKEAAQAPDTDKTPDTDKKPVTDNTPAAGTYENGVYTVAKGDYLKKIAETLLGKSSLWKNIYEANKETIKNPDLIYPGMKLVIPE